MSGKNCSLIGWRRAIKILRQKVGFLTDNSFDTDFLYQKFPKANSAIQKMSIEHNILDIYKN